MNLRETIIAEERFVKFAYQDSKGIWTCGVGFNIDKDHGGSIPDEVINYWLDLLIRKVEDDLDKTLPWWRTRPMWVQQAMAEMAYQMGIGGLLEFNNTLAALRIGDYTTARIEAADSQWARTDSPARAQRVIALFSATDPSQIKGDQNVGASVS